MSRTRSVVEDHCIARHMRVTRSMAALATADRQSKQAEAHLDAMRAEAIKAIVDAAPMLTAEQREQLRPILAGTIPADDTNRADPTAA